MSDEDKLAAIDEKLNLTKEEVDKISDTLFGDEGIVAWARDHIEAERERKEIYKELRKKLAVRGAIGALSVLFALIFYGIKSWLATGGKG